MLNFVIAEVEMLQAGAFVKTADRFDLVAVKPQSFQKFAFINTLYQEQLSSQNADERLTSISVTELLTMVSSLSPVK